ncbi:MAG: 4-alpha-glucanotransferase [Thermodesulfobacteriota bacterium]|nr:4-alpha-glucanotransferase [Thermodesulfobacteriota bacterium]
MKIRTSGILLPIQSLPAKYGIGDLGPSAFEFAGFLYEAGQHVWQILPVTPTLAEHGHSPYYSPSAFAFNPLLISPEQMAEQGLVSRKELPKQINQPENSDQIDYKSAWALKKYLLLKAYDLHKNEAGFKDFCDKNEYWLTDYALFCVLTDQHRDRFWPQWPSGLAARDPEALKIAAEKFPDQITLICFFQYVFYLQWTALKSFCADHKISIMGDMPIYVPLHSTDVWCRPHLFKLDKDFSPAAVSGVPPDYFSDSGQLWGHPVYKWEAHQEQEFDWWTRRIRHHLDLFDMLRIDHFRGLVAYWEVPANETTALNGKWVEVPVHQFLKTLHRRLACLPLVAEDLGYITADVREVMTLYDLPGMRVLVFGFSDLPAQNPNAPHNVEKNSIIYTGTHDTNTARGWYENEATETAKKQACLYFGTNLTGKTFASILVRTAMMSPARVCILPIQDILALDQKARINHPARQKGNWLWKLTPGRLNPCLAACLARLTKIYGRH